MGNGACFGIGDGHVTDVDRAVLDLKILQRNLRKRASALERAAAAQKESYRVAAREAPTLHSKRKQQLLLRHIGSIQKAIEQCHMHSHNVDCLLLDIGEASMLQRVTATMQDANRAMARMTRLMQVEHIESIIQDGVEVREHHRELQAAMGVCRQEDESAEFHVSEAELDVLRAELSAVDTQSYEGLHEPLGMVDPPSAPSGPVRVQGSTQENVQALQPQLG